MKKLAIIGCGRSGTKFSSILFKKLGLDIGHEVMGNDGICSWKETFSKKGFIDKYQLTIHQVRNPLKTIGSMQTAMSSSWRFIGENISIEKGDNKLRKCMKYWFYWNLVAESRADFTLRVESIFKELPHICNLLNIKYKDLSALGKKNIHSRAGQYIPVTWEMLRKEDEEMCASIIGLAKKYGYKV